MSNGIWTKPEIIGMLKHLSDEFETSKRMKSEKKQVQICQEAIALLTNHIGDAEIRAIVKRFIIL